MTAIDIITTVTTTLIAIVAFIFSWLSYSRTVENEKQRIIDDKIFQILEINLQYPDFDKSDFTNSYNKNPEKKISKQYEIYATMVWNFLEQLYSYYGKKKLKKSEYWSAFLYWSNLHYSWFSNPDFSTSYSKKLREFVDESLSAQKSP